MCCKKCTSSFLEQQELPLAWSPNVQPLNVHPFLNIDLNIKLVTIWRHCKTLTHFIRGSVLDLQKRTHSQERLRCRAVKRLACVILQTCCKKVSLESLLSNPSPYVLIKFRVNRRSSQAWSEGSGTDIIRVHTWQSSEEVKRARSSSMGLDVVNHEVCHLQPQKHRTHFLQTLWSSTDERCSSASHDGETAPIKIKITLQTCNSYTLAQSNILRISSVGLSHN